MNRLIALLLGIAGLLFAAGCDRNGNPIEEFGLDKLEKGVSAEADVRQVMGKPDTVWEDDDGNRILEYPKGPEGARTFMFRIGSDGKLQDYHQALTKETFDKVQPGMTKGDVRWLLGRPLSVVPFKRLNEEVWDWRYFATNPPTQLFNVHFDLTTGKVKSTSVSDDPKTLGG